MPEQDFIRLEDENDVLAAPLVEGVPEWIHPRRVQGVNSTYYRCVATGETLWDALESFKTDSVKLVSGKRSGNYGKTVQPGQLGLYFNRGRARFRRPGKYWRSGYRCNWARQSKVTAGESHIRHGDVEIVQLGQNQTGVVLLPDQSVAILQPGRHILRDRMRLIGSGIYNRAGIDSSTGQVACFVQHVYDGRQWRASLVDVPKDMAAVIERVAEDGAELAIVPPGRYTLTEEGVKFKKLLTLFEEERTVEKIQAWCNDSVEVFVDLQLRFKLESPRLIAHTKYADAFDVLQESSQSAVQSVVGQINYQQMMQSISLAPGGIEEGETDFDEHDVRNFVPFDEQVRLGCREYLQRVGCRVGVKVIDCFVKGRYFNAALTAKMQAQATSTLESVTKAKNIKRDLDTERKTVEADAINAKTRADAEYYASERLSAAQAVEVRARAAADAEATERMAAANARAKEILATAEAKARLATSKAEAEAEIAMRDAAAFLPKGDSAHAQKLALMQAYAEVASSFGDKTVVLDAKSEMGKMFTTMTACALAGASSRSTCTAH